MISSSLDRMPSPTAVVCIFLVSLYLQGSNGNLALPQTDSLISRWLTMRDIGSSDSLFDVSAGPTSLDENLFLNGASVADGPSVSNLADVNPMTFDSSNLDLFATDPTSDSFSKSGSGLEPDDSLIPTVADTGSISAEDY